MMFNPNRTNYTVRAIVILTLTFVWVFFVSKHASAVTADHLVISQVQITGGAGKATNDFVEFYNPTGGDVDLKGARLVKRTKTGTADTLLKSWTETAIVKSRGYYLWANSDFAGIPTGPDISTTGSIANDNGIALRAGPNDAGTIIDSVAWGQAVNIFVEGTVFAGNPEAGQSLERRPGGEGIGNGEDSNNNSLDFFLQTLSHPRNSGIVLQIPSEQDQEIPEEDGTVELPQAPPPGSSLGADPELTEIMPNPEGQDSGSEWVEFYNSSADLLNLSGWYIDDAATANNNDPSKSAFQIPDETVIEPGKYLAVNIPKGKFALNNSGGDAVKVFDNERRLRLKDHYNDSAPSGQSYAKDAQGEWRWSENPTPGTANIFSVPAVYSNTIVISEVLPDPSGDDAEDEFIELFNFGSDAVDLVGWTVADSRKRYAIAEEDLLETEIAPQGYFLIYRETSGIALNNTGEEEVSLYNPDGVLVSNVKFDASRKPNQSYNYASGGEYQWSFDLTPGAANQIVAVADEDELLTPESNLLIRNISEVKKLPLGSLVKTTGIVAVAPGLLGERTFYLQGSGIRVVLPAAFGPVLSVGMNLEIAGKLAMFHNELELRVAAADDVKISGDQSAVAAHPVPTGQIGETLEGYLVRIAGTVTSSSGDTFFLDDGSGQVRVYIRDSTGIAKPSMRKGENVTVTGIVSQYDENYRIMPRVQADIVVNDAGGNEELVAGISANQSGSLPRTGIDLWLTLAVSFGICYTILVVLLFSQLVINKERIKSK